MRKIKTINARDVAFLNGLRVSGVCSRQQALHEGLLTPNRLKVFELNHVIERYRDVDGLELYRFTDKGKIWVTKNVPELADRSFYRSNGYQHDMALFDRYLQLSPSERSTVLCESEIRNTFREHLENLREQDVSRYNQLSEQLRTHEISTPDMYYVRDDGCEIYFEATTSAYSFFQCSAKEAFALEMGGTPIEFIKI